MNNLKTKLFLSLLASSFLCPSCSNSESRIYLTKSENVDSFVMIQDVKELNSITRYGDSLVIVTKSSCHYCDLLYGILSDYISSTHEIIYCIDVLTYSEAYEASDNQTGEYALQYPLIKVTPTFLFYKDGSLKEAYINGVTEAKFSAFMDEKTCPLNYYCLNDLSLVEGKGYYVFDLDEEEDTLSFTTTALDKKIRDLPDAPICFTYRRCPDCTSLFKNVLVSYFSSSSNKLYYFETEPYYLLKNSSDETKKTTGLNKWSAFSAKYHLTDYELTDSLNNPTGVVPTLIRFSSSGYRVAVYSNERNPYLNSDNYLQYQTSFYDEVKKLKSDSKVSDTSSTSASYLKALGELKKKAQSYDASQVSAFLNEANE
jgi:thioredoxin-related protein